MIDDIKDGRYDVPICIGLLIIIVIIETVLILN